MTAPDIAHHYLINPDTMSDASLPAAQHLRTIMAHAAILLASTFVFLTALLFLRWWEDSRCAEKEKLASSRGQASYALQGITKTQILDLGQKLQDLGQKLQEQVEALPEGTALPPADLIDRSLRPETSRD
ncbi:hypothetical protein J3458_019139 [Metarhizium acridum]|uniref:Uncharacterized protein n=1 Tax=Metarhizium acridum (strain CQMa 102) TaxID=655827 RepID=E9DRS9_METAQ|nr:uncharacterized protein MAC_00002 [Metarhizium acridum CQMa 102]EFY93511.1 hypothetical protein MAC_00002 [Metarhizium acridum CQMa 102]KAG8410071.1 hypothetical protein J3458_019139 [Metarhizium acridum]